MNRKMVLIKDLIKEITMGPFGSDIKVDNFIADGIPVLNGSNVTGVKLSEESFKFISEEKANSLKKANSKRGDIVITHRGTLGQISYIPANSKYDNYIISQSQFRVTLKKELVDPVFFTYYFHSIEGQKRLLSFKNHVGVPALAQATTNFRLLEFPYRPIEEQFQIAKILSDLDSKIELNNRINREMEAMAKTMYDYWFVQFDFPNEQGKPYKSSGGKMVYNTELRREVPVGWEVKTLSKITAVSSESVNPMLTPEQEFKHYSIPIYDYTKTYGIEKGIDIRSNKFVVAESDILVSKLNPWFSRVIYPIKEDNLICSTEFVVWRTSNSKIKNYLFMVAKGEHFISHCSQSATGTSNSHKRVNPTVMMRYKVPYNSALIHEFGESINSCIKIGINKQLENVKLTELRNWLLPMMMNGQVEVKQVEENMIEHIS